MKVGAVDYKHATLSKSNWFVIKLKPKVNFVSTTGLQFVTGGLAVFSNSLTPKKKLKLHRSGKRHYKTAA